MAARDFNISFIRSLGFLFLLICQIISGFYLLAKVEEAADKPIYKWTHQIVSGHSLKHLCAAMVPVFLALMLAKRTIEPERWAPTACFKTTLFSAC